MENINFLELNTYSISKVDYCTLKEVNKNGKLYVEDIILEKKIETNKIEAKIRRRVFFEPEHMFCMSVDVSINLSKIKTEERSLKTFDDNNIDNNIKDNADPIFNRISLIISAVTSQTLGLPLITPPSFIDKKMNI